MHHTFAFGDKGASELDNWVSAAARFTTKKIIEIESIKSHVKD